MGACGSAVSYLRQALAATEGLADADEEVCYIYIQIISMDLYNSTDSVVSVAKSWSS